jgi:hypothetical protein
MQQAESSLLHQAEDSIPLPAPKTRDRRPPKGHFEKILEAAYPHHLYPIKHKLRDCTMMRRFMSSPGAPPGGDELTRDPRGGGTVLGEAEVTTITG